MRFLIVAATLLALVVTNRLAAQEPTGSISGRIYYPDHPDAPCAVFRWLFIVPADEPQPIEFANFESPFFVDVACDGTFSRSGLAPGDYLVAYEAAPGYLDGFDDQLLVHWRGNEIFAAKRVTLEPGQDLVVDIAITVPTPEPTPDYATYSIHGRVVVEGLQLRQSFGLLVVPADLAQPLTEFEVFQYSVSTDTDGSFGAGVTEDGDYLVAFGPHNYQILTPMPERLSYTFRGVVGVAPAMRVTVVDGHAPEIEIRIAIPTPQMLPGLDGTIGLPNTGAAASRDDGLPNGFVPAALLAVAAVALAATAIVLRARRR